VGAHALDELQGRPLRTAIPGSVLVGLAAASIAAACAIGVVVAARTTLWLVAFVVFGGLVVVAYNLELLGGAFHSDLWFAGAWGAFPLLTAYFASAERIRGEALAAAAFAFLTSLAQRRLSTEVRSVRRGNLRPAGEAADAELALRAPEAALRLLSAALPALAGAALLMRVG
jgi:hypothetical protein